jgi:hypothetical protein
MPGPERPKVGEILLRAGVIDRHQLQAALGEQRRWGRRLGSTLIKLGFVEERALVRALASQLGLPVATLEGKRIHPDVLGLVPGEVAEKHMVIPLFVKKEGGINRLFVGMEDPGSLDVLDELRFRSGMDVRAVMVGPSELAEAIDRYYRRDGDAPPESARPPGDTNPIVEPQAVPAPDAEPARAATASPREVPSGTEELARFFTLAGESEVDEGDTTLPDAAGAADLDELELGALLDPEPPRPTAPDAPAPIAAVPATPAAPLSPPAPTASAHAAPPVAEIPPPPVPPPAPTIQPAPPVPPAPAQMPPPPEPPLHTAPPTQPSPSPAPTASTRAPSAPTAPGAGPDAPGSAVDARMRLALQAVTQLLIEKGVMTRDEIQTRMRDLQLIVPSDD